MSPQAYQRLPQEGEPGYNNDESTSRIGINDFHRRPETYYGHGTFDAPSSDDEDDLLEKSLHLPTSPGLAERGQYNEEELDDGVGLVIGGQKKRSSSLRWLIISLVTLVVIAGMSHSASDPWVWLIFTQRALVYSPLGHTITPVYTITVQAVNTSQWITYSTVHSVSAKRAFTGSQKRVTEFFQSKKMDTSNL